MVLQLGVQNGILDDKDKQIIEMLRKNARISYTEIARRLGLSDVAVLKRVRKLEQAGIIKRYTIVLDPKKLGYNTISITGLDVEPENLFKVLEYLKEKEYVRYLAITSGDHSIITIIWARDSVEMANIHDKLAKLPGVKRVCPAIVLDVLKEN